MIFILKPTPAMEWLAKVKVPKACRECGTYPDERRAEGDELPCPECGGPLCDGDGEPMLDPSAAVDRAYDLLRDLIP